MSAAYNITLVNLSADARAAEISLVTIDRPGLSPEELQVLLENFSALDAVQNVTADPEIRVQSRRESYLIRTGQKKLFLYDALNRESPAQVLTVPQVLAELDGTAAAGRTVAPFMFSRPAEAGADSLAATPARPAGAELKALLILAAVAAVLWAVLTFLRATDAERPALSPIDASELASLRASLPGVYMTGPLPGQHGIVVSDSGDLKIFQVNAQEAPSVIYATWEAGRIAGKLALATNQPGGRIEVVDRDTLVYCGENYLRIP